MPLKVKLIEYTPNPEKVVAAAAKLCYSASGVEEISQNLDDESVEKFLNMLMSFGHASPIEHVNFTFAIEGVSRSLTHQLVRHRLASYSQQSQRYVKLNQFNYIIPPAIEGNEKARELFVEVMKEDQKAYDNLVEILEADALKVLKKEVSAKRNIDIDDIEDKELQGLKRKAEKMAIEDARYVFPNACETKIMVTMNARELIHFFNQRCCERAQWEIREMATQMLKLARSAAPVLFKNAGPACAAAGCPEGKMTCGKINEIREKFKNI